MVKMVDINGFDRNFDAQRVCEFLYGYGLKGKKVWVQVFDYSKIKIYNEFVKIGEALCL